MILTAFVIIILLALFGLAAVAVHVYEKWRDDLALPEPDYAPLGTRPDGIACEEKFQTSPAFHPVPPAQRTGPRGAVPGTAAAGGASNGANPPAPAPPPLPRLTNPAAVGVIILGAVIADLTTHRQRAWDAEVLAVFPPDRPWPDDEELLRKAGA